MHTTKDLFGNDIVSVGDCCILPSGRKVKRNGPKGGKNYVRPRGYAWKPGTGPEGKKCKDCDHCVRFNTSKKLWHKCDVCRSRWTGGRATDILASEAACKFFKPIEETKE